MLVMVKKQTQALLCRAILYSYITNDTEIYGTIVSDDIKKIACYHKQQEMPLYNYTKRILKEYHLEASAKKALRDINYTQITLLFQARNL